MKFEVLLFLLALSCPGAFSQSLGIPCSQNGLIRLVDGATQYEGRVEICVNNQWGTVCDDRWDNADTSVVCRQLGYNSTGAFSYVSSGGSGPIHLDEVACRGNEERLLDCRYQSTHDCAHTEDISVRCIPLSSCTNGSIRLQGSSVTGRGRVEVCLNDAWGTVCDDRWHNVDASVVCKQLGYSRFNARALLRAAYGPGTGSILLDEVACTGSEDRLVDCRRSDTHDCTHIEDASVRCNTTLVCQDGDIRLAGGTNLAGRVEICFNETWGTICRTLWSSSDARVACRQLGFDSQGVASTFGAGTGPIHITRVGCGGNEAALASCSYQTDTRSCTHNMDAGVRCRLETCTNGAVRLVNATRPTAGRVEVCQGGAWGTVCDDFWDDIDAGVVCRQLGYSRFNAVGLRLARYGQGTDPIHMDDVMCSGDEARLVDCPHITNHNCRHTEDASAQCNATLVCKDGDLRLSGSHSGVRIAGEGRVEICFNETWGTVCDVLWSSNDARVACRQLGFISAGARAFSNAYFGSAPSSSPILLSSLLCRGTESRLADCRHRGVGQAASSCTHSDDAGVRCNTGTIPTIQIRLVGGVSRYEGRIEVFVDGEWGTVCNDFWGIPDAIVACRQLGILNPSFTPRVFVNTEFGQGTGFINMDDVGCSGTEGRLTSCSYLGRDRENCGHSEDAGVRCPQCTENSIRLQNGSSPLEGRVEVCLGGTWGTVCDDGWSPFDAIVTCRQLGTQLGVSLQGGTALSEAQFGQGTGLPIAMANVACTSRETRLTDCPYHDANELSGCTHDEDAGVRCTPPPIDPPASLTISGVEARAFTLTWQLPPLDQRIGSVVAGFELNCTNRDGYGTWRTRLSSNSSLSVRRSGVEEYTEYTCCVAAVSSSGVIGGGRCVTVTTSQAAPSGPPLQFRNTAVTATSLSFEWNPPLLRHRNGIITQYRVNLTSVEDSAVLFYVVYNNRLGVSNLHPYYTYICMVQAMTSVGRGPFSSAVSIRTYQNVPSGPPSNITISSKTSNSVTMTILQPLLQNRNGIITGYRIRLTQVSNGFVNSFETTQINQPFTVTNLLPFTTYSYTVAAKTVNGTGPMSNTSSVTTNETAPSSAPRLSHTVLDPTTLRLTWTSIPVQNQHGQVRSYRIRVYSVEESSEIVRTSSSRSFTLSDLHPFYNYRISIAAFTVAFGPYSTPVTVQMPEDVPSGPPLNIRINGTSPTSFNLAWSPPLASARNGLITGYTVRLSYPSGGTPVLRSTTDTQITLASLVPSTVYSVSVAARTSAGLGPYSTVQRFNTSITAPSSAPGGLSVVALSSTSLRLNWRTLSSDAWNGERTGFTITVLEVETNMTSTITLANSAATQYVVSQLHPNYNYRCRVAAYNSAGDGPFSLPRTTQLPPDIPSGSPQNVEAQPLSPRSFNLSWEPPLQQEQNGIITRYTVRVLDANANNDFLVYTTRRNLTFPMGLVSVLPYRTYILQVAAETTVGRGPFSTDVTLNTPPDGPTHSPRNLTAVVISSTSFHLSWLPPPEEHHNGEIMSYRVNVTARRTNRTLTFSTAATQLLVTQLRPYFLYECIVSAVTVAEGPYSGVVEVRTNEAAPSAPPGNIVASNVTSTTVLLRWSPPDEERHNGVIRSYNVTISSSGPSRIRRSEMSNREEILIGNLQPFTNYSFEVAAHTVATGPFSPSLLVTTLEASPGTVQNFMLQVLNSTALSGSWQPPLMPNGVITHYQLVLRDLETHSGMSSTSTTTLLEITWFDLHPYYSYAVSIVAVTSVGYGPEAETQIQMPEAAPASSPVNIMVTNSTPTSVRVSWEAPPIQDRNGEIDEYRLELVEVLSGRQWSRTVIGSTSFHFDFLEENYEYRVRVAAVTISAGPFSTFSFFTTLPSVPSEAPLNVVVNATDGNTLVSSWDPPSLEHRNGEILSYRITVTLVLKGETQVADGKTQVIHTHGTNLTVVSLHPYYTYSVSVEAVNVVGTGPSSTAITVMMPEAAPSGPPQNFSALPRDSRTLELSWEPPVEEHQNGMIRSYDVTVVGPVGEMRRTTTMETRWVVTDLHPYYTYTCSVLAITVSGGPSADISQRLPEDRPEEAPSDFTVVHNPADPTAVDLSWTSLSPEHHNGVLRGYVVTALSEGSSESVERTTDADAESYQLSNLMPNTVYSISIAAYTSVGRGPASSAQIRLLPIIPSFAPTFREIVRVSPTDIQITWNVPEGASEIDTFFVRYRPLQQLVRRKRNVEDTAVVVETNQTMFQLTGLDPGFSYAVSVAAGNRAGRGNFSMEVTSELFESSDFVLHLSGAIVCIPWVAYEGDEKLSTALNHLASELMNYCSCPLSAKHLAYASFSCNTSSTDRVVLRASLVGTEGSHGAVLHSLLQQWVYEGQRIQIRGSRLEIIACSTHPGFEAACSDTPVPLTTPKSSDSNTPVVKEESKSPLSEVPTYAGIFGAVVLLFIVVVVVLMAVIVCKRRKKRQYTDNRPSTFNGGISNPLDDSVKESKFYDTNADDDHVYDDPNNIIEAYSELAPYNTLSRSPEEKTTTTAVPVPILHSLPPRNRVRPEFGDKKSSEPRYASMSNQQVQESSATHSTFLPPGYASPPSKNHYDECQSKLPEYDDCVPCPKKQACPTLEDYHGLVHRSPVAPNVPPGYASPRSLGFLSSQAETGEDEKVAEEDVPVPTSFKPQDQIDHNAGEVKDLAEHEKVYFPLKKRFTTQEGAYQAPSSLTASPGAGQPASSFLPQTDSEQAEQKPLMRQSMTQGGDYQMRRGAYETVAAHATPIDSDSEENDKYVTMSPASAIPKSSLY